MILLLEDVKIYLNLIGAQCQLAVIVGLLLSL